MTGDRSRLVPMAASRHVVIMGVSGSGKSTVARGVSAVTGLVFAEADDFHPTPNIAKMRAGVPLEDADRNPWLGELAAWMATRYADGISTVLACSALRRSYRDILRTGAPGLDFVHLYGIATVIRDRLSQRADHYMPATLLDSQVATLEPLQPAERGIVLDASLAPDDLVTATVRRLALSARSNPDRGSR